jgi:sugar porter (SP) family MFS transporter
VQWRLEKWDLKMERDDLRRIGDDEVSVSIVPNDDVNNSDTVGLLGDEERYGTFRQRHSPPTHEPTPPARLDKTSKMRQTLSSLGFCLGALAMGNALGWSSTAVPNLESPTSSLPITKDEAAWVSSLICLGALLQGPSTGYLLQRLGRRGTFIVFADSVYMLYVGRLLTGFAIGSYSVAAPIFIAEIASPSIRGTLGTMFQLFVVLGIFSMYVIGMYVKWKTLAILCSVLPFVIIFALYFLKDSPTSYLMRGRPDLARKAMIWFRNTADIEDEMYALQRSLESSRMSGGARLTITNILCARDPTIRQPLLLTIFLMLNQQLSGINAVIFFTVHIFQSSGQTLDSNVSTIVVGAVLLFATIISSFTVNHMNRRFTLISTQAVMTLSLVAFGAFFYLKKYSPQAAMSLEWVPLTALAFFIISFSFGLGPLAWLMMGELLSPKIAAIAGGIASIANWSTAFIVTICFTYLIDALGDYGAYWLFAAFGVVGMAVTAKYVPETRNKSLREIQDHFASRH